MLLSATPHSGAQAQFDALCRIGAAGSDAPLLCFRRSRTEADLDTAPVRSKVIAVRLTEPEHRLHRLLDAYTGRLWSAARGRSDANPALLATLFRKRALSSSTSLAISLRRRLSGLESPESTEFQPWLPIDDTAEADSCPAAIFRGVGLPDRATERNFLEQTLNVATMAALAESKARLLLRLLSRIREPAIVFSEFRDTAELLFNLVRDAGHRAVLLHGSLTPEERLAAAAAFRQNAAVLLATDAASEGLNLHHRCRLVIHYELPWSPSRLHQRCGRVNRIGQARRVHEIALVAADTAEQLVIGPLLRRTATSGPFSRATFVKQLSETRMASQIFGSREDACTIASAEQPESDSGIVLLDLRAEAREEADRLAELRRLCTRTNPMLLAAAVPVARGTRRSSSPDSVIVVLVPVTIRETGGGVVEEGLIAVRIDCSGMRWRRQQNAFRWQLERALPALEHRLGREVRPLVEARLAAVTPLFEIAMAERHQRNRALAAVRSHARQLVQPSLFSRVPGRALSASLIDELPEEREAAPRPAPRLIGEHGGIEAVYCGWLP